MIDLHAHSNCSDGTLSPTELIGLAVRLGLSAVALTDHDTVAGIDEAAEAAARLGIRFIPGVEIEAAFTPGKLHVLGLGLKEWHGRLESRLLKIRSHRTERNRKIIERMRGAGIEVSLSDVEQIAVGSVVGRPHFAEFLRRRGLVTSIQEGFDRFLATGKRFYAKRESPEIKEVVDLIREAGGKVVIAHPLSLKLTTAKLARLLEEWRRLGVDGIEAYHSNTMPEVAERLARLARRVGMFATAGSDFHGDYRPDRHLGRGPGGTPIEDEFLELFDPPRQPLL